MTTEPDHDPRFELLAAVDQLTKPVPVVRWQDDTHDHEWVPLREYITGACGCKALDRPMECPKRKDGVHREGDIIPGQWACQWCDTTTTNPTRHVEAPQLRKRVDSPLLEQLRDAIGNNIGGTGGGKLARERTPIDVAAFAAYEDVDGRIRAMMGELGGKVGKDLSPEQVLRAWFTMWTITPRTDNEFEQQTRELNTWLRRIHDILQPPDGFEITAPCPMCGNEWITVGTGADAESVRVLSAVERENLDDSYAVCKACDVVWRGVSRMRGLRIDVDDAEQLRAEVAAATGLDVASVVLGSNPVVFFIRVGREYQRGLWHGGDTVEWVEGLSA